MTNTQGKTVTRNNACEVWRAGDWTWFVLKKYQSPEKEYTNPYARWFCDVVAPICPDGELRDVYVREIKSQAVKIK